MLGQSNDKVTECPKGALEAPPKTSASSSPDVGREGLSTTVMLATHQTHTASPRGDPGNSGSYIKKDPIASISFLGFFFFFFLSEIVSKPNISLERSYF